MSLVLFMDYFRVTPLLLISILANREILCEGYPIGIENAKQVGCAGIRYWAINDRCFSLKGRMKAEGNLPKNASTVILLRPEASGKFEVFMTRRPAEMNFMGGVYVFPGGSVGEEDYSEEMLMRCRGLSRTEAQQILGGKLSPELSIGHSVAAIRELFEETGILLSVAENGAPLDMRQNKLKERLVEKREALVQGRIDLRFLLESEGLYCDLSCPVYFSHRVTPEKYATRFDTRFYLAQLPPDQSPLFSSQEVTESLWMTPERALDRSQRGDLPMMPPTLAALGTLAAFDSWQSLRYQYQLR